MKYAQWSKLRAEHLQKQEHKQSNFWPRHPTPPEIQRRVREAYLSDSEEVLFETAVRVYTVESFVYRAVNAVLRDRDESRGHLAPYVWLLQTAVRQLTKEKPHKEKCFRTLSLSAELQAMYVPQQDSKRNVISFEGFLSCTMSATRAISLMQEWHTNTMLMISVSNPSNPRCCSIDRSIAHLSSYPEEEEALYPMGQQFQVI